MAAHNQFEWDRGEDILITFTHTAGVDITGWTILFRVKLSCSAPTLLTNVATITDGPGGIFTVAITAAQNTATLTAGMYVHAAVRTDSGSIAVLSEGPLTVHATAYLA